LFNVAIGSDYLLSGDVSPFKLYVTRWLGGSGDGLTSTGTARFFAVNFALVGVSIKPIVGCVAIPLGAAVGDGQPPQLAVGDGRQPEPIIRVREVELSPSRTATHEHRCQPGERLVGGEPGVLFHKEEAPSAREIRQVKVVHHVTRDRIRVRVRTGPDVGDDERVTLQMIAHCRP
jgi:hypothetical protein